jgi:hypothetical protein
MSCNCDNCPNAGRVEHLTDRVEALHLVVNTQARRLATLEQYQPLLLDVLARSSPTNP